MMIGGFVLLAGCSSTPPPAPPPPALLQAERAARAADQYSQQGNWNAALAQWEAAADQYRLLNQLPELAVALHNAGLAYQHLDQPSQAILALQRAAELNRLLGRRTDWWRDQIALLAVEDEAGRAVRFEQLLPLFSEVTDPQVAGYFLNELGLWQVKQNTTQAEGTFQRAAQAFRKANDRQGAGATLANQARLHERQTDYQWAANLWAEALAEFQSAGDPLGVTHALAEQGRCLAALGGEPQRAKELLRRAAKNYQTLGADEQYTAVMEQLQRLESN